MAFKNIFKGKTDTVEELNNFEHQTIDTQENLTELESIKNEDDTHKYLTIKEALSLFTNKEENKFLNLEHYRFMIDSRHKVITIICKRCGSSRELHLVNGIRECDLQNGINVFTNNNSEQCLNCLKHYDDYLSRKEAFRKELDEYESNFLKNVNVGDFISYDPYYSIYSGFSGVKVKGKILAIERNEKFDIDSCRKSSPFGYTFTNKKNSYDIKVLNEEALDIVVIDVFASIMNLLEGFSKEEYKDLAELLQANAMVKGDELTILRNQKLLSKIKRFSNF